LPFFFYPVWKVISLFILSGVTQTQLGETDTYEQKKAATDKTSVLC
jgi:hypothetical protein